MCGNLDVTNYRNGDAIPQVTDPTKWKNLKTGAWCYYNNDPVKGEMYGKLYNLYAIKDPRGLAPDGWHIPTNNEWTTLIDNLEGTYKAGGKLKSIGTKEGGQGLWRTPNQGAKNESDFSALPSGYRSESGSFLDIELSSCFWSSTIIDTAKVWSRSLSYKTAYAYTNRSHKNSGFAVRCMNDKLSSYILIDTSDAVFTITAPMAEANDIDMKQSLIGRARDSVVTDFIRNVGQCKFRVDSIFVRCKDTCAFFLLSGFPKYNIAASDTHFAELRFIPLHLGKYDAELVIITQSDTIIRRITGEGIKSLISVQNKVINFGKVGVGYSKDTNQVITIKNMSDSKIHIVETKHNKPNDKDFTKGNGGSFDLEPHATKKMDLSFCPSAAGRTVGTLEFHYNGLGSPAVVQLYGIGFELIPQALVSPANEAINVPIDTRLCWNLNVGQTTYILQVSKNEDFTNMVLDTAITDTVFDCPQLDFLQLYYWRVKPGYQANQNIWSPIWHFTTLMDAVNLIFPLYLSKYIDNKLVVNWEKTIYDRNYRLQISENDKFKSKLVDSVIVKNVSYNVENLKYYLEYFWRVRNESGDTLGYWSDIWQFNTRMSDLLLIYPENTQPNLEKEISFRWSNVIGAEYYQLQISKNGDFTDLVYSMDSLTETIHYVPDLEYDVMYFWRVRVWNKDCIGSDYWSEVWTFRTSPTGLIDVSEVLRIIPNPANDFIAIKFGIINPMLKRGVDEGSNICIYNTLGEKIMSVEKTPSSVLRINISTLPKGMYFVKAGNEFIKFIKL